MKPISALSLCLTLVPMAPAEALQDTKIAYPDTRRGDVVETLHGHSIADPYRWLEDPNSPETAAWVEAQNKVTFAYLEKIPRRVAIRERLTKLWNYERYGVPNDGLQNQAVIYKATSLTATPEVLIDPNTLSSDGTVALSGMSFSDDGKNLAYATSASGSDWMEWKVRDVATGKDLPDDIKWSKFSGASWKKDGTGFYYSRYDAPKSEGEAFKAVNKNQKVFFHRVGTPQDKDEPVYERPDQPDWGLGAEVTEDGRWLLIYQSEGTNRENRIFLRDLADPNGRIEPFLDKFDASYNVVGNDGPIFYVMTNKAAPKQKVVAIDTRNPSQWKTIIPESSEPLQFVTIAGGR